MRDNGEANDVKADASHDKKKLDAYTKVLHNVQTNLLSSNKNQHEIKAMILGMRQEIASIIGSKSNEDVEQILNQFGEMSGTIHSNFSQINSRLNDLENNVISAIKEEKNKEIASLKEQLAAK